MVITATEQAKYLVKGCIYAALWPAAQSMRRKLYPPPRPLEIALTFDDGPHPEFTPRLLDVLAVHKIRAAFFLVGKLAEAHPALVRRIVAEGHVIGNHSWSHPNLAEIPIAQVREELVRTSSLLEQITRTKIRFFRPPYGACNPEVLSVARTLGMLPVFWNAIAADWEEGRSASQVSEDLSQQIDRNRRRLLASCIVLHDGRAENPQADCSESVQSAAQLIGRLQENYRFVSIQSW